MPKDLLIFLSDQHSAYCCGYAGDPVVRTPQLDRIAAHGTVFSSAYTSCPLCVPARMSFLAGQLPSRVGIFDNAGSLSSDQATFLHALGAAGYETVLCGRMHFEGPDQRHGFSKRIFGDITNLYFGDKRRVSQERGRYAPTLGENGCLKLIGGGNSPTLEYDRGVIEAALDYLNQEHDKPQCIVIGTYAPHFPYIAPPQLYDYYLSRVPLPLSLTQGCDYQHPVYSKKMCEKSPEVVRAARAAYYGMTEFSDQNIGKVHNAWKKYLERSGREGVFVYVSDHGDQAGARGLYGKKTFFEPSAHIPLIFEGDGIPAGAKIDSPVSLLDLSPTLCEIGETTPPPQQDGQSLLWQIEHSASDPLRYTVTEFIETLDGKKIPGRCVRFERFKYITYWGYEQDDLLFDLESDPEELHNAIGDYPQLSQSLRRMATSGWEPERLIENDRLRAQHLSIIGRFNAQNEFEEDERWKITPQTLQYPENPVFSDAKPL